MGTDRQEIARALPDYLVDGEIGRGEYGVVWAARHRQLGRRVAIKQLAGPVTDPEHRARFRREARVLAQLRHPHVVTVYDYREDGDLRLLVLELLPGGTFADRRVQGMNAETAIAATLAAASGLHHAHDHGILHRDVKPENLMFDEQGVLEVTDFGIARVDLMDATVVNLTRAGEFFGTPAYVSPEQAGTALSEGWPPVGPASDQYSLAVVLYESLSGRLTHDPSGGSLAICTRRMSEPAQPLREVAPAVPPGIADVVMTALARDPSDRFDSVQDFGAALGAASATSLGADWLAQSTVQLRDTGPIRDAARGSSGEPFPPPAAPTPRKRRIGLMVAAFAGVLVLAITALYLIAGNDPDRDGPNAVSSRPVAAGRLTITDEWSVPTGGNVFSSPATADNLVVVGSDDETVYALDAASGSIRWTRATGGPVRSSPAVADGAVFVGSNDGKLYALDLATGQPHWQSSVGYEIVSSPAVSGGTVVVGSDRLYAFDTRTGAQRWTFATKDKIVSSPTIVGDTIVVGSNDQRVYGIGLADGRERWHLQTGGAVQSSPVGAGATAYVGSLDGNLYAIDTTDGNLVWSVDLGSPVKSSPARSGGHVFVGTDAGRLVALEAETGKISWSFEAADRIDSSPVVVNDLVVVGSDDGTIYAVEIDGGTRAGTFATGGPVLSSPTAIGSDVVVGSQDDRVYRLRGFGAARS
jgi:serine/threonine-protein kinase